MKVEMLEKRDGHFPVRFSIGEIQYRVSKVLWVWKKAGRVPQLVFRVETNEGAFDLTQNAKTSKWTTDGKA